MPGRVDDVPSVSIGAASHEAVDSASVLSGAVPHEGSTAPGGMAVADHGVLPTPQEIGRSTDAEMAEAKAGKVYVAATRQGCYTRYKLGRVVPAMILASTAALSVALAVKNDQVESFPCELSTTANENPSYLVFSTGLSIGGILFFAMFERYPSPPWKRRLSHMLVATTTLGLCSLGWICDGCNQKVHQLFAFMAFLSALGLGLLRRCCSPFVIVGLGAFAVNACIRLLVSAGTLRGQLVGGFQWLGLFCIFANCLTD